MDVTCNPSGSEFLFSCFQFLLVVELVARDVDIDR